jgi:translation initiation factor 2 beta subunit (eIF-2beta)/eIF-5
METRNLKISKEIANRWYNGNDEELKQLALQTFPELAEKELPKSWEELGEIDGYYVTSGCKVLSTCNFHRDEDDKNVFATKEQAEASIALAQLSQLMKVYNGDWVADWTDNAEGKHCVWFFKNEIATDCSYSLSSFLAFKDAKTRDLFLENFRDLILTAKPLL